MARARNIKPGFFTNDALAEVSPLARILFAGLWCFADREGRLNDRPKKIKAEILPYDECNTDELLEDLAKHGFLIRYEVDGAKYIQVVNFDKHQNPHVKEQASEIPAPDKHSASTVQEQDKNQKSMEVAGLIPSSLIPHPSSLIPDAGFPSTPLPPDSEKSADQESIPDANAPDQKPVLVLVPDPETELQAACRRTWEAYSAAYANRYGTEPVRNAKVSSLVKQFVKRIGFAESPDVAAFYVRHSNAYYVKKSHDLGSLLSDAEKIRMEWATGRIVTATTAQQIDRTQSNFNAANEAIRMLQAERMA